MSKTKLPFLVGNILKNLGYIDPNGQYLEVEIVEPRERQGYIGHPFDDDLLARLNLALLAESWATSQILQGFDIRTLLPVLYDAKRCSSPDTRDSKTRFLDAVALVESIHVEVRQRFSDVCVGKKIGYGAESIEWRGPKAARTHFGKSRLDEFNEFMRTEKGEYAKDAIPGISVQSYIEIELAKIRSLLVAVAKRQEWIMWEEQSRVEKPKRPRGRPSKADKGTISPLLQLKPRISKIDFEDGDQLFWIAEHSGVNPALLWKNLKPVEEVLDVAVVLGKASRGLELTETDIDLFGQFAAPFFFGQRLPETANEQKICDILGSHLSALENTAKRNNQPCFS